MNPRKGRNKRAYRCRVRELPFRYGKAKQQHLADLLKGQSLIGSITFGNGSVVIKIRKTGDPRHTDKVNQEIDDAIASAASLDLTSQSEAA